MVMGRSRMDLWEESSNAEKKLQNEDKQSTRQCAWGLLRSLRMTAGLGVSKMSQVAVSSTDGREGLLEEEGSVTQGWKLLVWLCGRRRGHGVLPSKVAISANIGGEAG